MEKLDRNELYKSIKALNLQDKVKEIYGKNFTQVPSAELKKLIDKSNTVESKPEEETKKEPVVELEKQEEEQEEKQEEPKEESKEEKATSKSIENEGKLTQIVFKLVTKLRQIRVISETDANYILGEL